VELESEEDQGGSVPHSSHTDQDHHRDGREDDDDSSGDDDDDVDSDRDGGPMLPPPEGLAPPPTATPPVRMEGPIAATVQASSLGPLSPGSVVLSKSALAKLGPVDAACPLRSDPTESFGLPLS
jgi:hypothetical protein